MGDLVAPPQAVAPPPPGWIERATRALRPIGSGAARLIGRGRDELGDGLRAAGASIERAHQRLALTIVALFGLLLLGAAFRSLGWPAGNYLLIALTGIGALWAFTNPLHLAGVLLVGGGMAAWRGAEAARDTLGDYARLLGRLLLAFLVPLFLFAMAPGDRGFATSLKLIVLTPVVLLAMWLFGRLAPRTERWLFVGVPAVALSLVLANMLVPERTLAALGVPAWLRAARPQDDELARIESALERRRNAERASALRGVREKIEAGVALTPEDEAVIVAAQRDRVTLTGWVGAKYDAALAEAKRSAAAVGAAASGVAAEAAKARARPTPPSPGTATAPPGGWSAVVAIPAGYRICTASDRGEASYVTECAWGDGAAWRRRAAGGCTAGQVDRARFQGRRGSQAIRYDFVAAGASCEGHPIAR